LTEVFKYHYVYLIQDQNLKSYIGCRTSNVPPDKDLGIKYFSSGAKEFVQSQRDDVSLFTYHILETCQTRKEALEIEIKFHRLFDVGVNESFYNKAKQTSSGFDTTGLITYDRTPEHNKKMSEILTGRKHSETHKRNISLNHHDCSGKNNPMYGRDRSLENNPMYGKKHSEETKNKNENTKEKNYL